MWTIAIVILFSSAVFEDIKCLHDCFQDRNANRPEDSMQILNAYNELQNETENQEEEHIAHYKGMCMNFFYDTGCFITSIANKCGASLKDAMVEIVKRSNFFGTRCNLDIVREMRSSVESLNIDDSQKDALKLSFQLLEWEE